MNQISGQAHGGLMLSLVELGQALKRGLDARLDALGISMAKYGMLKTLIDAGEPLSLSEVAVRQRCVRSNVTQLMDRLEADGLVQRVANPQDRRSVTAVLTGAGVEKEAAGARAIAQVEADFAASVPEAERQSLERLVTRLLPASSRRAR